MSKVYLYTARATTAEKVQFDKKDTSVMAIQRSLRLVANCCVLPGCAFLAHPQQQFQMNLCTYFAVFIIFKEEGKTTGA